MALFWLPYAHQNGKEWTTILLSLTPKSSDRLLSKFDRLEELLSHSQLSTLLQTACASILAGNKDIMITSDKSDISGRFFDILFFPCGTKIPQVRKHLVEQQNEASAQVVKGRLSSILGFG